VPAACSVAFAADWSNDRARSGIAFRLRRIIAIFAESARYYQSDSASQLCLAASRFLDAVTFERFAIVSGRPAQGNGKEIFLCPFRIDG